MKFNAFKVILVGGILGGALILLPNLSKAQESSSPPASVLEQLHFPVLDRLNVTADQETQLVKIGQNTRTQLETLITAEQRETFKSKMAEGATFRDAIAAMNLSADQRTQVRATFQSARQEAATVLTPEQRQQAREFIQSHRGDSQ
jgi:periplasmic protein CpxP/Spy